LFAVISKLEAACPNCSPQGIIGWEIELAVRAVDAREIRSSRGLTYFYLFEDESGQVEGVGQRKARAFGSPPGCLLR